MKNEKFVEDDPRAIKVIRTGPWKMDKSSTSEHYKCKTGDAVPGRNFCAGSPEEDLYKIVKAMKGSSADDVFKVAALTPSLREKFSKDSDLRDQIQKEIDIQSSKKAPKAAASEPSNDSSKEPSATSSKDDKIIKRGVLDKECNKKYDVLETPGLAQTPDSKSIFWHGSMEDWKDPRGANIREYDHKGVKIYTPDDDSLRSQNKVSVADVVEAIDYMPPELASVMPGITITPFNDPDQERIYRQYGKDATSIACCVRGSANPVVWGQQSDEVAEEFRARGSQILAHEISHHVDVSAGIAKNGKFSFFSDDPAWADAIENDVKFVNEKGGNGENTRWMSPYTRMVQDKREEFAESLPAWIQQPDMYAQYLPNRAAFLKTAFDLSSRR